MSPILVRSDIPATHPKKVVIEADVEAVFEALPGDWHVSIRRAAAQAAWWGYVEVDGPREIHRILLVSDPDEIRRRVKETFRSD
ncbi:MAG: hypothetical protein HY317_06290 [Acidobacteria bacterium]|nr:hypothetical protein [Acidobacteriota bacterium]